MCGRYRLSRRKQLIQEYFDTTDEVDWEPRYNIAPSQSAGIIRRDRAKPERRFLLARWGLIPYWAKDPSIGYKLINARSETVTSKPAFREAFESRRCLIPADGFYEWVRHEVACVIVRRGPTDRTCHPIGSTLRGVAIRKRIV